MSAAKAVIEGRSMRSLDKAQYGKRRKLHDELNPSQLAGDIIYIISLK